MAQSPWDVVLSVAAVYGLRVVGAVLMLLVGYLAAGWLAALVDRVTRRSNKLDPAVRSVLCKIVRISVLLFTVVSVLKQFGFETASLVALIGAAGLAIGLALQGTLTNVASGVMILSFRPFRIGDLIDLNGALFVIDEIGLFLSRAHLPDGPTVTIPNSKIWGNIITNLSVTHEDKRRINEVFGISYSDDMEKAIAIINEVLAADERILTEPPSRVAIGKLNSSSVDLLVHAWTLRADWFPAKLDLNRKVKEAFDQSGITIPFPQQDVHLFPEQPKELLR